MIDLYYPLRSLQEGTWFKLICGASFQHLPAVRNLTLAYALAGADCVDVAADPAVIATAKEGLQVAARLMRAADVGKPVAMGLPWLMVSLNDGEDPHFRKAAFDPDCCPVDCPRPCEAICPAQAIVFNQENGFAGVVDERCYGCGRCLPLCPIQQISTRSYVSAPAAIASLVLQDVDAVEIHTQVGRFDDFARLWRSIAPHTSHLKLVAISCPDGEGLVDYLRSLYQLIAPLPCPVVWQTDGRPMSGDIGDGATRACVRLGQKVLAAGLPGYVQLAGGTNRHTVPKLKSLGLLNSSARELIETGDRHALNHRAVEQNSKAPLNIGSSSTNFIAGVAYGSYARVLLAPVLEKLEQSGEMEESPTLPLHLENAPSLLQTAVQLADSLVSQLKGPVQRNFAPLASPAFLEPLTETLSSTSL